MKLCESKGPGRQRPGSFVGGQVRLLGVRRSCEHQRSHACQFGKNCTWRRHCDILSCRAGSFGIGGGDSLCSLIQHRRLCKEASVRRIGLLLVIWLATGMAAAQQPSPTAIQPPPPSGGNSQSKTQPQPADENQKGQPDKRGAPETPFIVPAQHAHDENDIRPQSEKDGGWYARPDWWVACFTLLLFIATTVLWIFTGLMWRETKKLAKGGADGIALANTRLRAM